MLPVFSMHFFKIFQKYKMNCCQEVFTGTEATKNFEEFLSHCHGKYSGIFILTDSNTRLHCLPRLQENFNIPQGSKILEIKAGEQFKTLGTCERLWHELAQSGADRHSLLICLGGGVLCDMGAFVASTFQRGMDFILLPTTLLAMVDAAIGGKTGVNLGHLKNYVGLFSFPEKIFVFTDFLKTLPAEELVSGFAEVVKHALISTEADFNHLLQSFPEKHSFFELDEWSSVIQKSIATKLHIVEVDVKEQGLRKALNLGHTIGHAFEAHALKRGGAPLLHGFAVAMGLIVELRLSVFYCGFPEKLAYEIIDYLLRIFPVYRIEDQDMDEILDLTYFDKKNRDRKIRMTLLASPGDVQINIGCSRQVMKECLHEYIALIESAPA